MTNVNLMNLSHFNIKVRLGLKDRQVLAHHRVVEVTEVVLSGYQHKAILFCITHL